ncbi:hypothetical protein OQG81_03440 [Streptococcus macedonicus]|uniref:Uncharacterized protein n=1 Tax=Streptococcus macedonicus TaxID=59310 RepID=A0AA47IMC0_STRMC|nr:hypothetical protein [Streptococcus macedonicus]WAK63924.1 hypothetical protein OQG81_03440 [Streptococcus macedonicus]
MNTVFLSGDTLANVGFLNIDDNWIYNTHGQAVISFTNTNKAQIL